MSLIHETQIVNETNQTNPSLDETQIDVSVSSLSNQKTSKQNRFKVSTNENNIVNEMNFTALDNFLENEKKQNKIDAWNKIDKTVKIQKLNNFADRYGRDNILPVKEVKMLKMFFIDSLEKGKLQKTKQVIYNKDTNEITGIPALFFNTISRNFTLKILDSKRISTMKSLTPKRMVEPI
jgi:hypothetical protein